MARKGLVFELRIIFFILIAVVIVAGIGVLAYRSLSAIVSNIKEELKPDQKSALIKQVQSDLSDAENGVQTYTITQESEYLEPFYQAASSIDNKVNHLYSLSAQDTAELAVLDSLNYFIEQKFIILRDELSLQNNNSIELELEDISLKLQKTEQYNELPANNIPATTTKAPKRKSNIISRLFSKKKPVTVQETIEPPTVATPPVHSVKSIRKEVDRLQELQAKQSYALMEKQLELSQKDKAVMDRIRLCFAQLEELEKKAMAVKTALAEKQAREVNRWIMTFCIAVSLLLFVLGIVIIRYTRKINAYSKALKKAKTEAERLSKVKESFISTMSHEIRTPMNAIFGFSEQLLETPLNDAQKEQVEIIKKSSDHLVGIINDILDYSKLGAGKLELNIERFKPRDIVNEVIRMMKPLAGKKNIDLNTDIAPDLPQVLLGDPMRLKQILINLVSNAVKFTDKGEVSLKCLPILENDTIVLVQFMIKDTGIGIPSSKITSIFNEFEQAEGDITRRYGGTGLGLTITQKLVTLQGGTIEVDSEEGKGTMIKFTILYKIAPVIDEPSPEKNEKYSVPTDLAILVADDEEYNRMLMTAILNKWGVIHKEVSNGEEAVRELENRKYDVVLMDVQMPVMNGLQATRYIREHPMKSSNQKIPILGVMASVSEEIRRQCMEAGMNDCLNKPFKEKELSEKISDLLNKDFMEENKTIMDEENKTNENSPGYDLSEIYKVSDNSKDFVKEMIRLFIKTTSEGLVALKRGMKNNSWEYVAYQAHKISAPCKHIAAEKLYQLLKKIEERVRNDYSTLQVGGLMEEAEAEINRLIQLLEVEYAKIQS